ncbi:hypothetical protein AnigIFM60653_009504 [Aspergillus niger]|nr:hypothetical protein AnigIFM60653_009504 [Aspergillus niger]
MIVPGNDSAIPGCYHAGHDLLDDRHKNEIIKQRLDRELEELAEGLSDEEIDNLEEGLQGVAGPSSPSSTNDSTKNQTNPSAFWMDDVLTPNEKIELGRKFATYDPSDTYWKIVCINMALHLAKRKEEKARDFSDDNNDDEETEDDAWLTKDVDNAVFENDLYQPFEDFGIPATVAPTTEALLELTPENVTRLQAQNEGLDRTI